MNREVRPATAVACVVFDFDGVLVDSNAVKRDAYARVVAPLGVPADLVARALADCPDGDRYAVLETIVRRARASGCLEAAAPVAETVAELARAYGAVCEEHTATCAEGRDASATLARLAARYPLYVASDTPEEPLRRVIARRGWSRHFRGVLGRPLTKVENLRLVAAREAVVPAAIVLVGDSGRDLAAARECGCCFIGVRSDGNDFEEDGLTMLDDLSGLDTALAAAERAAC
jgi:phosphoglycolate phosphatase-like HAD superfamily hydrolase